MDNDAFTATGFRERRYVLSLEKLRDVPNCVFVVLPDVVGDAPKTLQLFDQWREVVRGYGFPVALVAQDGMDRLSVPWDLFDVLFIGGSTKWKLGAPMAKMVAEAKNRDKWVHMGRVNSVRRIRYAQAIGCDSFDGTHFSIKPRRIERTLPVLETHQHVLPGFFSATGTQEAA